MRRHSGKCAIVMTIAVPPLATLMVAALLLLAFQSLRRLPLHATSCQTGGNMSLSVHIAPRLAMSMLSLPAPGADAANVGNNLTFKLLPVLLCTFNCEHLPKPINDAVPAFHLLIGHADSVHQNPEAVICVNTQVGATCSNANF